MNNKSNQTNGNLVTNIDYRKICIMQQTIMDCANYSIISTNIGGIISSINKAACETLGYTADELIGQHTPALFHDANEIANRAKSLSSELGKIIQPGFEVFIVKTDMGINDESEWTYIRKDGTRLPVLLSITALKDYSGKTNGYLGISFDISKKIYFKEKLRAQKKKYKLLFERAEDSIFLMQNEIFVDCNPATLKMFGCTREQIINQTPMRFSPEFQPDGQESRQKAIRNIQRAKSGETSIFEWQHLRYDGSTFYTEVTLSLLELQKTPLIFATVRNISRQKEAENELALSNKTLAIQNENLWLINHLSDQLRNSSSFSIIVDKTLDSLLRLSRIEQSAFFLIDETKNHFNLAGSRGFTKKVIDTFANRSFENSLTELAINKGKSIHIENVSDNSRIGKNIFEALKEERIQSGVLIPLLFQGMIFGSIIVVHSKGYRFSKEERKILDIIGNTVSQSLGNAQQIINLEKMALQDSLTGLSNRLYFHQSFKEKIKKKQIQSAALILLDLNRFKEVNDTLGHHIGDELLQKIGPRIKELFTEHETILSRLGGDEFILLIDNISEKKAIMEIAKKLAKGLQQPFKIGSMKLEIDASIGIAKYPEDGKDSHSLLRSADVAMYEAKNSGGGIRYYDAKQDKHTPERLQLMAELNGAIRDNQLVLHYQPKIELLTGEVSGFEALVRWQHPKLGLLYPDKFIPLAEMSDSIHLLTKKVLEIALAQQQRWIISGYNLPVAVNLSARNLIDDRCVSYLAEMVIEFNIKPGMLELELTETALMQDPEKANTRLNRISALGIILSIDDFGTGYSSLSYLRRLPINLLKIDREFVKEMVNNDQDSIIVSSTIALAHNLDLSVIAEGVEDSCTVESLKEMKCDLIQGYHICKPKPWVEIESWLKARNKKLI